MDNSAGMKKEAAEADVCCANCGIAGVDDVKLEDCDGCDLVKYCSDKCRENHREQHEEECKNRMRELHDKELFTQPKETHLGECPLCFLPMPLHPKKSLFYTCCSEIICMGCVYASLMTNKHDEEMALRCPFCREVADDKENDKRLKKRMKANDPAAMCHMGYNCYDEGDYDAAFDHFTKAAELGNVDAHCRLGICYHEGEGVEKDEEKEVYHLEQAAIGGHHIARTMLGCNEEGKGDMERAVQHHIIAANLGYDNSMKALWKHYSFGHITKEDLDATLRKHQAAVDAMKSAQREVAEAERAVQKKKKRDTAERAWKK
jgi:hypothetical protein